MPSQKGSITKEELSIVAKWMVVNLKMMTEQLKKRKSRGRSSHQAF